jgi:hypothetical protein
MKKITSLLLIIAICLSASLVSCLDTHNFSEDYTKDETHHWHECLDDGCTEISGKTEHTFNSGSEIVFGVNRFVCTECEYDKIVSANVKVANETEFRAAMNLGENFTAILTAVHPQQGTVIQTTKRDGNKIEKIQEQITPDNVRDKFTHYAEFDGDKVYTYSQMINNFEKTESSQTPEQFEKQIKASLFLDFASAYYYYTFNNLNNKYEAAYIVKGDDSRISDVSVGILDGKVAALSFKTTDRDTVVEYSITFEYGNTTVTLPA